MLLGTTQHQILLDRTSGLTPVSPVPTGTTA
jgi:hypothetical protein